MSDKRSAGTNWLNSFVLYFMLILCSRLTWELSLHLSQHGYSDADEWAAFPCLLASAVGVYKLITLLPDLVLNQINLWSKK